MSRLTCSLTLLAAAAALLQPASAPAAARSRAPQITSVRCLGGPHHCPASKDSHAVAPGGTLLVGGNHVASGMKLVFPRRTAAVLRRSGRSFRATVPSGARSGRIYILTRKGVRSRSFGPIRIRQMPKPSGAPSGAAGGATPNPTPSSAGPFAGAAMWIWYLSKSDGGNLDAIAQRASQGQFKAVYIKSSDGSTNFWSQFTAQLVQDLHARGLQVCAWQYVYGTHPAEEAQLGAQAVKLGADCLIIDAEAEYEGKYASAQTYIQTLRGAIGASFPVALAGFPYVDYHERFPFSVLLGPGGAQWNMPQMYWHEIGTSVDRVFSHTYTQNLLYGRPILPLGQTYGGTPPGEVARFRQLADAYGAPGHSFWDWQETTAGGWSAINQGLSALPAVDTSQDYASLGQGAKGDQVVWMQEHLAAAQSQTPTSGVFDATTAQALSAFQSAKGLPATGKTDPATWQALLALSPVAVDWTQRG